MRKFLILTDSHVTGMRNAFIPYISNNTEVKTTFVDKEYELYENLIINDTKIDMLGLMGRTAYNFANHLEGLEGKDLTDYKIILFLGGADQMNIVKHKNMEVVVDKYIATSIARFGKENIILITPVKDTRNYYIYEEVKSLYKPFITYMQKRCREEGLEHHELYSIIGETTIDDLQDAFHIKNEFYPILYKYLGLI